MSPYRIERLAAVTTTLLVTTARAVLKDRLAQAGLDVAAPGRTTGDVFGDGELHI